MFSAEGQVWRMRPRRLTLERWMDPLLQHIIMDFRLTRLVLEETCAVSITEEEFGLIRDAQQSLVVVGSIEEKINLFLENFVDFEQGLLVETLHHLVFHDPDRLTVHLQSANRRLVNLLTSGRLYLDQVLHDLKSTRPSTSERSDFVRKRIDEEKHSSFELRTMEALRNFVQHRGLPVDVITHHLQWHEYAEGEAICRHNLAPLLRVARLEDDPKFSNRIAVELRARGAEVDLRPLVRAYVAAIGRIHMFVREQLASVVTEWRKIFVDAQERYERECTSDLIGLAAVRHDGRQIVERVHLSSRLLNRYDELRRRNENLSFYARHVVTSAIDLNRA